MNFTLLPTLAPFAIGFVLLAALTVVAVLGAAGTFFVQNHAIRVRRHEGVVNYYGHLALGQ